jgi:molybdopterin converting factor small subunit
MGQVQAGAAVAVRYWAGARAAAGVDQDDVPGCATVGDALAAVVALHPALDAVVKVSTVLLDGRVARRGAALAAGAVVEVLPPFAGG